MTRAAFFAANLAVLALLGAFAWKEWNPPWKRFQRRFRAMQVERQERLRDRALSEYGSPRTRSQVLELEASLRRALEAGRASGERERIRSELSSARAELQRAKDRFEKARYGVQVLERRMLIAPKPKLDEIGASLRSRRQEVLGLQKEAERRGLEASVLEARLRDAELEGSRLRGELKRLRAPLDDAQTRLKKLRRRPFELRQTVVEPLGAVDRCQSCHLGVEDPEMKDAPIPFRTHPELLDSHPIDRFGCTSCHGGQGRATSLPEAHGVEKGWSQPLRPLPFIEASCGACHREPRLPQAPLLKTGRRLFLEAGCLGCHKHQDYPKAAKIGPDLAGVGSKVRYGWLKRWLKRPKDYLSATRMPDFQLSEPEISALAEFLWTLKRPIPSPQGGGSIEDGERLFKESRCVSCHALGGRGGTLGPDLGKIQAKVRGEWLSAFLRDPRKLQTNTRMPRYRFTQAEASSLADYLLAEYQDFEAPVQEEERASGDPALAAEGRRLAAHYGCYGCHDIPGVSGPDPGAELSEIGAKTPEHLDFGLLRVEEGRKTLPDWLDMKLRDPRAFRNTLKMPRYEFTDAERRALITALLSFNGWKPPEGWRRPAPAGEPQLAGEFGALARELNCLACHSIRGKGGSLAPDLSWEGSQVRPEWLKSFLLNPDVIRPALVERMPKFRLSEREASVIVQYLGSALVSEDIPVSGSPPPAALRSKGAAHYRERGCEACHQIGLKGGSVGPNLSHVGSRLRPEWIARWLKDPHKYRPEAIEPRQAFSDEEIAALTSYLAGLR